MIKRLWRSGRLFCLALLAIGVLLRITTLRDSLDILAPLYYATPWPVLAFLSILASYPFFEKRKFRWAARIGLAVTCLLIWLEPSWNSRTIEPGPSDMTLLYWNLQHKPNVNEAMVSVITDEWPDIAVFVERGEDFNKALPRYRELFPDYSIEDLENLMVVFCRGKILNHRNVDLSSRSRYNRIEVLVDGRIYVLYVVDIDSNVLLSRQAPLEAIRKAATLETHPTVIAGDFNTPIGSVHFDAYRENFAHTFEESGTGMPETWPYFIPLLAIDHIWTSRKLKAVKTRKVAKGFASDHAGLVTQIVNNAK